MSDTWGADVSISMPDPPASKPLVAMEGLAFTEDGICHPITEEERSEIGRPVFAPPGEA